MKSLVMALVLMGSVSAFANDGHGGKDHPCAKVKAACEAAGFKQGAHKDKKGLWKDCVDPVMEGKSVAGVTVATSDIEACKMKKEEKKK
ncbi:hypothetical protein B9G69_013700 [Bdellovibrio sp. SKB1291214]|uniref:hypothetical protein n=1 Tax=Bdellovibrio sp. SKB1291214 TaxID=1732569 RepID=UPI000B51C64A|nr:hypothetical protein [Bdellovibrio sp. SKB1291214]UYL08100.1 hypothetical protein B9G69_013700 [Bdellovibrio sp. SKB1291214]